MSASSANETQVYTIEMVAEITHLERERIILFHRDGLVHAIVTESRSRASTMPPYCACAISRSC